MGTNGNGNGAVYLLTIRGKLKSPTLEAARATHNATAGNPQGVAAARSLGDLSHMTYVPLGGSSNGGAGDFLILDLWNNIEGLNKFFADPQVHEGGNMIHEQWDKSSSQGEYSEVIADRFMVKVEGNAPNIDALKSALGGVDVAGLAALKNEGVQAN